MNEEQVKAVIGDLFLQVVTLTRENQALREAAGCPQPSESGDDRG